MNVNDNDADDKNHPIMKLKPRQPKKFLPKKGQKPFPPAQGQAPMPPNMLGNRKPMMP